MMDLFHGELIFISSFVMVFLKAMQQQNVIHGNWIMVPFVSLGLAVTEVAIVLFVVKSGWAAIPWMGTGAGLGAVCAMWLHRRLFKRDK